MKVLMIWVLLIPLFCISELFSSKNVCAEEFTKRKALLIGNYKYRGKQWRLNTPKNDIKTLQKILKQSGFEVSVHYNLKTKSLFGA